MFGNTGKTFVRRAILLQVGWFRKTVILALVLAVACFPQITTAQAKKPDSIKSIIGRIHCDSTGTDSIKGPDIAPLDIPSDRAYIFKRPTGSYSCAGPLLSG